MSIIECVKGKLEQAITKTIEQKYVTVDFAKGMEDATQVGTSAFAKKIIENL